MPRLTVNRNTGELITRLNSPEVIAGPVGKNSIGRKRGDSAAFEHVFGRPYGQPEELDATEELTSFRFGAKLPGQLGGDYVVSNWDPDTETYAYTKTGAQRFADAVTTADSATITSASAGFSAADIGLTITGIGIPAGATIAQVASATSASLSAVAVTSGTGVVINIGRTTVYTVAPSFNTRALNDALVNGTIKADVANQTARYALTGWTAGQIAAQRDDETYWVVVDAAHLNSSAGWAAAPQKDFIDLKAETEVEVGGEIESTVTYTLRVENDVNKGVEGGTVAANPSLSERLAALEGSLGKTLQFASNADKLTHFTDHPDTPAGTRILIGTPYYPDTETLATGEGGRVEIYQPVQCVVIEGTPSGTYDGVYLFNGDNDSNNPRNDYTHVNNSNYYLTTYNSVTDAHDAPWKLKNFATSATIATASDNTMNPQDSTWTGGITVVRPTVVEADFVTLRPTILATFDLDSSGEPITVDGVTIAAGGLQDVWVNPFRVTITGAANQTINAPINTYLPVVGSGDVTFINAGTEVTPLPGNATPGKSYTYTVTTS